MPASPSETDVAAHSSYWRFGIRSLLMLLLLAGCLLAVWRWQADRQLEHMAMHTRVRYGSFNDLRSGKAQLRIRQLFNNRSFRSSGLYERIRATDDGFGHFQFLLTNAKQFEVGGRQEVCLTFIDQSSPPNELIVVYIPHGSDLSWIEIDAQRELHWLSEFLPDDAGGARATITLRQNGEVYERTYQLREQGIELIAEATILDTKASNIEILQAMGIDAKPRESTLPGLTGPESDLQ